ncbi:MAG: tetratricopeptide repeat protein [Hahellaceae bacterium]|nr:tetratricopeptide repeat protein [Hahellaceae bacterium]
MAIPHVPLTELRLQQRVIYGLLLGVLLLLPIYRAHATTPPENLNDAWQLSYNKEYSGDLGGAMIVLEPYLKQKETRELTLLRYGWLLYSQQNYNDSADYYLNALRMNTLSVEARMGLMLNLMAQKRWSEAMRYGQQVLSFSDNYLTQIRMLSCEEGLRDWSALRKRAQALISRYPTDAQAWVYLARAENWEGNINDSLRAYRQVVRLSPTHQEALLYLADNP